MILRPSRLADALAADALSEREKFQYLLVWAISGVLLQHHGGTQAWDWPRLTFLGLSFLITLAGLMACFQANVRGDNRAFLERYLCLSVPVGLVTYGLYFLLYYALGFFALAARWIDREAHGWNRDAMSLLASMLVLTIYYIWMRQLLQQVAGARAA